MGWQKLVMLLVNIVFVKQNINQVLFILFTKLVNCTFATFSYSVIWHIYMWVQINILLPNNHNVFLRLNRKILHPFSFFSFLQCFFGSWCHFVIYLIWYRHKNILKFLMVLSLYPDFFKTLKRLSISYLYNYPILHLVLNKKNVCKTTIWGNRIWFKVRLVLVLISKRYN